MDMLQLDLPQTWASLLLILKAAFALVGVVLLLWHMDHEWEHVPNDQRARYLLLLGYGVFQAGATYEQLSDGVFGYRHLAALILSVALVGVAGYSIWCAHKRRQDAP